MVGHRRFADRFEYFRGADDRHERIGFRLGLAISTYEWMAAATLVIVAIFFIPVYLKNKIYTMPQFLNQRYNGTVAMIMAIFWLRCISWST